MGKHYGRATPYLPDLLLIYLIYPGANYSGAMQ